MSKHLNIKNVKYILQYGVERIKGGLDHSPEQQYFFMHIPKTAGTSFLTGIYDNFAQASIYPNFFELQFINKSKYLSRKDLIAHNERTKVLEKRKIIIGHYPFALRDHFKTDPIVFTFFRDPFKRALSEIIHLKTKSPRYKNKDVDYIIDDRPRLGTLQSRMLGYKPIKDNYDLALRNLEKIHFVGITEKYEESIKVFNKIYQLNFNAYRRNTAKKDYQLEITEKQLERLKEICAPDYKIYEEAVNRFSRIKNQITHP